MTRDRTVAAEWLQRFEGAGLDGVIAKPEDATYQPGKRAMFKIKHARTADCVVSGFRWHKKGPDIVGSLLLGLFDDEGKLHHVGRHLFVHDGEAQATRRGTGAAAQGRAGFTPLAGVGPPSRGRFGRQAEPDGSADARRAEPMERRQRSVVGAATHRAGVRSEVRPHAGRSLPPCGDVPALARATRRRRTAATISSRSLRLTSLPTFSVHLAILRDLLRSSVAHGFGIGGSSGWRRP